MFDSTAALRADHRAEPGASDLPWVRAGSSSRSAPAHVQAGPQGYPESSCKELGVLASYWGGWQNWQAAMKTFLSLVQPLEKSAF